MSTDYDQPQVQHFILPKAGSSVSECEDSIGIRRDVHRYCVADGATEAFDSRRWARLLTKHWVSSRSPLLTKEPLVAWLSALGDTFRKYWAGRSLPWYAEEKARSGAFAAFVGISLFEAKAHFSWQAIAMGDSCLFQVRSGKLQLAIPLSEPEEFGYHPILFPSNNGQQLLATDSVIIQGGRAQPGDVFLLVTDAIAAWYLTALKNAPEVAQLFDAALASNQTQDIESLVAHLRNSGQLRNDDIAVVRISIPEVRINQDR